MPPGFLFKSEYFFRHLLEISANVLTFARKVVAPAGLGVGAVVGGGGGVARATQIVFAPSLAEAKEKPDQYDGMIRSANCIFICLHSY